jgi:hypothetical protein
MYEASSVVADTKPIANLSRGDDAHANTSLPIKMQTINVDPTNRHFSENDATL